VPGVVAGRSVGTLHFGNLAENRPMGNEG
jgi:hypothetical protein